MSRIPRFSRLAFVLLICWLMVCAFPGCAKEYLRFDVVGDSDSEGINPDLDENYGWVHMLFGLGGGDLPDPSTRTLQSLWPGIEMHNSAVSGSTAAQWQTDSLSPRLQDVIDRQPDLVVVMIGGNDFLGYFFSDGEFSSSEQSLYRTHLTTIIDRLQAAASNPDIVVLNYYDLADGESESLPFFYSLYRGLSDATTAAVGIIQEVAQEKGCTYVDIHDDFMYHCYGVDINASARHDDPDYVERPLNLLDLTTGNIHPVTAGYRRIHLNVYEQLKALKALPEATPETWLSASQKVYVSSDGGFYAMVYDYGLNQFADTLDGSGEGEMTYGLNDGSWIGAYVYDYASGAYSGALYLYKDAME